MRRITVRKLNCPGLVDLIADLELLNVEDARGHYTVGKALIDNVIDRIRKVAGASPPPTF